MATKNPTVHQLIGKQVCDYTAERKKNDNVFNLTHESFELKMDITRGVTKTEMNEIVDGKTDPDFKNALRGVTLVDDSKSYLTIDDTNKKRHRKALVVYGRRADEKYDVLVVYATQVKELSITKLVVCGLVSICAGIVASICTKNVSAGVGAATLVTAGSSVKAACDYSEKMPDVLYSYILDELVKQQILSIQPNGKVEFILNN